jgi:hypothetical protein
MALTIIINLNYTPIRGQINIVPKRNDAERTAGVSPALFLPATRAKEPASRRRYEKSRMARQGLLS